MELSSWLVAFFSVLVEVFVISADTNPQDTAGLTGVAASWNTKPSNWVGIDPCQDKWIGIICTGNRVTSIRLSSLGLSGTLSGDIQSLSQLQELDLSYNQDLHGSLPSSIGALSNLQNLILVGCSFSGEIPNELGQLSKLVYLSLNSNRFTGSIPASLGNLLKLYWIDLADNKLTGGLPVFDGMNPGLDNLTNAKHLYPFPRPRTVWEPTALGTPFYIILSQPLWNESALRQHTESDLQLTLLDNNNLTGSIPSTIGLLSTLEVLRFDNNYKLTGTVPGNINNLTKLAELHLENNQLTGPLPDLTGMSDLTFVDMSNNSFNASDVPAWLTALPSLTSLYLEDLRIGGQLPQALFSLPEIQTVRLQGNRFNGTLSIGPDFSSQLQLIDLRDNQITDITVRTLQYNKSLILVGNPICTQGNNDKYCTPNGQYNLTTPNPYSTPKKCAGLPPPCLSNLLLSPNCICAVPYKGILFFRSPPFSDLSNSSYYMQLEQGMRAKFIEYSIPVDSISLHDAFFDVNNNLQISLEMFPSGKTQFNEQDISNIGFMLSNQTYKPPPAFGPYYFIGQGYSFPNEVPSSKSKTNNLLLIGGIPVAGLVVGLVLVAIIFAIAGRKMMPENCDNCSCCPIGKFIASCCGCTS